MAEERKEVEESMETAAQKMSMADFEEELNASLKQIHEGDVITGTVIDVTEDEVVLDLKYYTEGVIRKEDFSADPTLNLKEAVQVGDEISATVVRRDGGQGQIMLSKKDAANLVAWDKLRSLKDRQENIRVKVAGVVKSGVIAYVEDIRGFIPASRLSLSYIEDLETYLLKEIDVRVIEANQAEGRLILSAREILREQKKAEDAKKLASVQVGSVVKGTVESLQSYGAFVRLENGLSGLVHISQISTQRIKSADQVLHVGDEVDVKVIGIKDGKISLSIKALAEDAEKEQEEELEHVEIPKAEAIGTSLGDLFKNIKL